MAKQKIYHVVYKQDAELADVSVDSLDMQVGMITAIGSLLFNLTANVEAQEGLLNWNTDDGTLQIGMPGGNVVIQLGQETTFRAKNVSGDVLANGTAIVITGATGARPEIDIAETSPSATSGSIGLTTEGIGTNQSGFVTVFGLVRDLDTSGFSEGARVFLSDTPGELSANLPAVANRKVFMGIVVRSNENEGVILLSPLNLLYLDELSGMNITNLQDGDIIVWDSATSTWVNQQPL